MICTTRVRVSTRYNYAFEPLRQGMSHAGTAYSRRKQRATLVRFGPVEIQNSSRMATVLYR